MPERSLTYYRTQWFEEAPGFKSLEDVVRELARKAPNVNESAIVSRTGLVIELRRRQIRQGDPVLLYCASHMPGAEGSVVPVAPAKSAGPLETVPPPKNKNFLEGSLAVLITGDHCLLCSARLSQATFRYYLFMLIRKFKLPDEARKFNFAAVANRDKISEIIETGVASIGLSATMDELLHAEDGTGPNTKKAKTSLRGSIAAILGKDPNLAKLLKEDLSNINTRLIVSLKKKGGELAQEDFDDAAQHILDEEEKGITIRLRSGTIIDAEKMKLSRRVEIANHGNTIECTEAWKRLTEFYSELKKDKLIG